MRTRRSGASASGALAWPRGRRIGSALDSLTVTVPGGGEADGELTVDAAPDDLESCAVRIDSEDDVPVARRTAPG